MEKSLILRNKSYYQKRLEFVISELDLAQANILDLGCGEMLLKRLIERLNPRKYTGIDQLNFSEDADFVRADIIEYGRALKSQFDYIFCLGVLDHLTEKQAKIVVDIYRSAFKKKMIVSISNFRNPFLKIFSKRRTQINFSEFNLDQSMYLLKIPLSQFIFRLPKGNVMSRIFATEIIYICSGNSKEL